MSLRVRRNCRREVKQGTVCAFVCVGICVFVQRVNRNLRKDREES